MTDADRAHDTLDALCRCIVPVAYDTEPKVDLATAVTHRLATLPQSLQRDVAAALRLFDHPVTAAIFDFSTRRFPELSPDHRAARLRAWETSRIPLRRTVYQAVRRIVLSTYYAIPEVLAPIGYAGPLRDRLPVVPWEGPLVEADATGDDGVIARSNAAHSNGVHGNGAHDHVPHQAGPRSDRSSDTAGVTPGASLAAGSILHCDVCVVGSGAGGAVIAARLAEAGKSVIVIEEGGHYTTAEFTDREMDMIPALYADAGARATDDASISLLQGRCIGGGSTVNWMLMLRPRPWVMEEWSSAHGAEMLSEHTLTPALERVEAEVGAGYLPHSAHSASNRIILDGAAALGWSATTAMINARGCVRAGTCGLGCSHGAKRSAGVVYLPRATAAGAQIISDVRADRIERAGDRRRVQCSVLERVSGAPRAALTIDAVVVVCAAGAIGTPALLLRSGMGSRAVGRFLRLHPTTAVRGSYERVMYGAAGVPQSALLTEFMQGDDGYGFWVECPPMLPSLASVAVAGFGVEHRAAMLGFPHQAALIVLTRDGVNRDLSSGDVRVDARGCVRIRYRVAREDRANIAKGIEAAARLHFAAGAHSIATLHAPAIIAESERELAALASASLAPNRVSLFSAHVNGTCRMGVDPATSACTPDGDVFGERGIYVADGSVFPTAPGVNPQATIMAIATLVAERVLAAT
ncbi:MAG: GMC family oxidoreductase [Longimicrobiales bacterium]